MELLKKINRDQLQHEYGLDGQRLLPWDGFIAPFGGAYCVVRTGSQSTGHINEPAGEGELFIGISGAGRVWVEDICYTMVKGDTVFIPPGAVHYVDNCFDEDFHFYSIWWDPASAKKYIDKTHEQA